MSAFDLPMSRPIRSLGPNPDTDLVSRIKIASPALSLRSIALNRESSRAGRIRG